MLDIERKVINRLQYEFPVCEYPFAAVAEELEITEEALIKCVNGLLESGLLTRFGPLYDAQKMGGNFSLCAMKIPEEEYDAMVDIVNAIPEVAHNYQREHELNMWFVLATEKDSDIAQAILKIEYFTGHKVFNFPKEKEFFVGLYLQV